MTVDATPASSAPALGAKSGDPPGGRFSHRLGPFLLALGFWCGCVAVAVTVGAVAGMVPSRYQGLAIGLAASAAFLLLTLVFVRASVPGLRAAGVAPDGLSLLRMAAGLLFGFVLVGVYFAIAAPVADLRWARNLEVGLASLALALAANLAGAAAEELAFRGYPMRRLMAAYGLWPAQVLVAIAFILYHILIAGWPVLPAIVGTGLGSLLFGMAAVVSRGLALPIGLHAAWNFGMWAAGTRELPAFWQIERIDPASAELANGIAYPVAGVGGIIFFLLLYRRQMQREAVAAG